MKVSFIRAHKSTRHSHPENVRAPLDIGYSASLLESKGHKTYFIDMKAQFYSLEDIKSKVDRWQPDLVLIKSQTPSFNLTLNLAKTLKEGSHEVDVGVFGQHATIMPSSFLSSNSSIDYCLLGEPEATVVDLVEAVASGEPLKSISRLVLGREEERQGKEMGVVADLDQLPRPKHEWFLDDCYHDYLPLSVKDKKKYGYVLSSRGCPYDCFYCSPTLRVSYGSRFRTRSPPQVVDEMEYLQDQGVNVIVFKDDLLTFSKQHTLALCREIRQRDLDVKWFAQTRADSLDRDIMLSMKCAGCETVGIGVESGSSRILNLLNKKESKKDIRRVFKLAKKHNIKTVGFFMVGSPTERGQELLETLKFCKELQPDMIQVAFFTPYPGSQAYEQYLADREVSFSDYSHYNQLIYNPSRVADDALRKFQKKFYWHYLSSPGFLLNFSRQKIRSLLFNLKLDTSFLKKAVKFLYDI